MLILKRYLRLRLNSLTWHLNKRSEKKVWVFPAHLVERATDVNGTVLDDLVHHLRDRLGEVGVRKL